MSDHYYDAEGNEASLDQLCRLEPEWAANRIREYEQQLDEYSDVLRGLASYVGCGGYNSYGRIAPKVAGEKIQWGIDHLLETLETELADLKQEAARLRFELDRYRRG